MGCVHGKCCSPYPASSYGDRGDFRVVGLNGSDNIHHHGNYQNMLSETSLEFANVPSHNFHLEYSVGTQRGYYPDFLDKENQDSFCIRTEIQGNPNLHFFGVFDGHGQFGAQCSNFVRDRLVEILSNDPTLSEDPLKAYNSAFLATNSELHDSDIDDTMSGTTAITVLVSGDTIFVANVGDSRAVIAMKNGDRVIAEDLSCDQTPFRKDEYERVKLCGARVLTADQVEGLKDPDIQNWGDEESDGGDPPRLWVQDGLYPGTAFTRSLGDSTAEKIGVIAVPEVKIVQLTPNHLFFVIASDGVFEFLSSQVVIDMVLKYSDTQDACAAIAGESYSLWLENETRTDDITIIIVRIKDLQNSGDSAIDGTSGVSIKSASLVMGKGRANLSASMGSEPQLCERNPASVVPSPAHPCSFKTVVIKPDGPYKVASCHPSRSYENGGRSDFSLVPGFAIQFHYILANPWATISGHRCLAYEYSNCPIGGS
ncbi:Protein phosphatase 2C (PP2C)-like domain [Macleaya cordata]|uniref:protein-serine/threonine phosphatase n=1 Tax=Macleaya cordata TaxID=56857 RepID=A0A200Q1S2_MACCD|nr:Protein phosphatase 2C (PP2C)-like domain [Macleaya cordata]